ncbi:MAG: hypothetical protein R3F50_16660 [Gammaproteobacteria bacterium]
MNKNPMLKKIATVCLTLITLGFSASNFAQTNFLAPFNFIMEQAEALLPELFPTGSETFEAEAAGASWLARFYEETGVYGALNIDEGNFYVLGGPWTEVTFIDSVDALLTALSYSPPDGAGGSSDGQNSVLNQGSGDCINLTNPTVGTVASYTGSIFQDGMTGNISYTTTYTAVSDSSTTTETDQQISASGFSSNSLSRTTSYIQRSNGWLYSTETDTEATTTAQGFSVTSESNTVFDPPRFESPETICSGMVWFIASVVSTTTGTNLGVQIPTLSADTGESILETLSVSQSITVPAGTFSTVHQLIKNLNDDGVEEGYSESWFINNAGGVPARIDVYQSVNGIEELVSRVELQSLSI